MRNQNALKGLSSGVFVAALALSFAGCGGGSGGSAACGAFTPCGGNVVGNWTITGSCFGGAATDSACPGATSNFSGIKMAGTVNLTAAMTYVTSATISGNAEVTLPNSCLMQPGLSLTCADLNALYALALAEPDSPLSAASCRANGNACACSFTFRPTPSVEQGTYVTAGNTLTMTSTSDPTPSVNEYCVTGNKMNLKETMTMPGGGGMGMDAVASVTLTR